MKSQVTDIEFLSKTRQVYSNELSFAGRGLKLNKREDVKEIVDAILNCQVINVLRLEGNTISPEAADELAKALIKHPELERFIGNDIFTGRLKDEIPLALKSICGAIDQSGAHLVEINMSDNAYGPIGLDALVSFFESGCCFSLKEIRMHNNGLGPEGAKKFANALEKCYHKSDKKLALKVFVCGRNRLEYEGSRTISNVLKQIGTLEEIQMPQNGIRPNGIEFLADACANNPNLRIVNFNDNTFRKIGCEWMGKALGNLNKLEYLNLGDCLLGSKGAIIITRSILNIPLLKEVIISFNEINLQAGIEISQMLMKRVEQKSIKLLDINGNRFGEDGKLELKQILDPIGGSLASLSEDEGSDEEEDEEEDNDEEEESEEEGEEDEEDEENSEVVVDDEYEDYDQVENHEYEGYDECENEKAIQDKFGNFNIVQKEPPKSLFSNFKQQQPNAPGAQNQQLTNNLFSNMIKNNQLMTSIQPFDAFILNPSISTLASIDQNTLTNVSKHSKFNASFLIKFLYHLSKIYDPKSSDLNTIQNCANTLTIAYFQSPVSNTESFADEFLTEFGFLKSEDKTLKILDLNERVCGLLESLSKQVYFPKTVKDQIVSFLNFRNSTMTEATFNPTFKKQSDLLIKCFS